MPGTTLATMSEQELLDWMAAISNANAECHVWRPIEWLDGTIEAALRSQP